MCSRKWEGALHVQVYCNDVKHAFLSIHAPTMQALIEKIATGAQIPKKKTQVLRKQSIFLKCFLSAKTAKEGK